MCGIVGAAWFDDGKPLTQEELRRMTAVLTHRGPDGEGFYVSASAAGWPGLEALRSPGDAQTGASLRSSPGHPNSSDSYKAGAAFGHRRLSIIDLGGGAQ